MTSAWPHPDAMPASTLREGRGAGPPSYKALRQCGYPYAAEGHPRTTGPMSHPLRAYSTSARFLIRSGFHGCSGSNGQSAQPLAELFVVHRELLDQLQDGIGVADSQLVRVF